MSWKDNGGNVFPFEAYAHSPEDYVCNEGISRRDYAAIHIAAGIAQAEYSKPSLDEGGKFVALRDLCDWIAVDAYSIADALIKKSKEVTP